MAGSVVMPDERMLRAMAEQLKLPLLQIARSADLSLLTGDTIDVHHVMDTATAAMRLVDSYLLSLELQGQASLTLEPVSVSAVLQEVADKLYGYAKRHDCDIEVGLHGKYGPVMAHPASLSAAVLLLGHSLIDAAAAVEHPRQRVVFGAHRSARGLVAGVFTEQSKLTTDAYRRARALYGTARQPLPSASPVAGAGIFVADALMHVMASPLHVARHDSMTGLAATLHPSSQLALV